MDVSPVKVILLDETPVIGSFSVDKTPEKGKANSVFQEDSWKVQ
jgi:hypothetical protein